MGRNDDAFSSIPELTHARKVVNLAHLKQFASEKLPTEWPLRDVLMAEENEISVSEFLARLKVYLFLLRNTKQGQ